MLSKWIDQGAKFDGANPADSIASLAPAGAAKMEPQPTLNVVAASGKESVLFSRDIAPVIAENCIECHGAKQQEAGLRLDSRDFMMKGSESAPVVVPEPKT